MILRAITFPTPPRFPWRPVTIDSAPSAKMKDNDWALRVNNLGEATGRAGAIKSARLVLEMIEIQQAEMKNWNVLKIEEVQIPATMATWAPSLSDLAGISIPDQDMINPRTVEPTGGAQEIPAYRLSIPVLYAKRPGHRRATRFSALATHGGGN